MRALVWITESGWEGCVDQAAMLLAPDAEVTLLHVAATDVEGLVAGGPGRLLGRHPPPRHEREQPMHAIAEHGARALLESARDRLEAAWGQPARSPSGESSVRLLARRGRLEREVLEACADADLLVLGRDGDDRRPGPGSLGRHARFVVDHAPCTVALVWPGGPPAGAIHWPAHLRR